MKNSVQTGLLALQSFQVLFLLLHDWVPMGRLNNLEGLRASDALWKRVLGTLISTAGFAALLWQSFLHRGVAYPMGLHLWLWVAYGLLFVGELQAWWIPYLLRPDPELARRYQVRFAGTYRFLPEHNGIAPDTLHTVLHGTTIATLVLLACL